MTMTTCKHYVEDAIQGNYNMPNRIIKESICTSGDIEQLAPMEEIFFYRLIVNCDDYGRMDGRPAILRAKCFPLKLSRVSDAQVEGYLRKLVSLSMALLYQVDHRPYIQLTAWERHQQQRAQRSKYPSPDDNGNQMISDVAVIQSETESETESESEKKPKAPARKYELGLSLSEDEYEMLLTKYGTDAEVDEHVQAVIHYSKSIGKRYKSLYDTILNWDRRDEAKKDIRKNLNTGNAGRDTRDPDKYIRGKHGHVVQ